MKTIIKKTMLFVTLLTYSVQTYSFCGFYVAKADIKLFNKTSQVILVRDGNRTVVTMSNDFQGNAKDFALVVPVPVVLKENDIKVVKRAIFDKLDTYSGPRLVEYYDENPCYNYYEYSYNFSSRAIPSSSKDKMTLEKNKDDKSYGVTIEAKYTVGEYDILILSAKESVGLKDWLILNGYKIPETAHEVLDPYIKSNLKFFVVKVNLEKLKGNEFQTLNPIQISYESPKFMLPIRLGMANADGSQDMIVYAFTKTGRVESSNYRTVKIPTDRNIPLGVRPKFGQFYADLFKKVWKYENKNAIFLEYAWNVSPNFGGMKCDPCVGPPPIYSDLKEAGVEWVNPNAMTNPNVFFTRLHVRYSRDKFPQDLLFQVTPNTEHFQGRYILTNPAWGGFECDAGQEYLKNLTVKRKKEVEELAALTGWDVTAYIPYITELNKYIKDKEFKKNDFTPVYGANPYDNNHQPKIIFTIGLSLLLILLMIWFNKLHKVKA
jgi:hypothetical protein